MTKRVDKSLYYEMLDLVRRSGSPAGSHALSVGRALITAAAAVVSFTASSRSALEDGSRLSKSSLAYFTSSLVTHDCKPYGAGPPRQRQLE
jgi:hypothetical protein